MDQQVKSFDYIITGAGCAGLSLAMHMIRSDAFSDKKILLVDKDPKRSNDRTWCFWQKESGIFEPVVTKKWSRLSVSDNRDTHSFQIDPYQYKMIRGIDFYNYCFAALQGHRNVSICFEEVEGIFSNEAETGIFLNRKKILCDFVFNSILFEKPVLKENEYWLLQHFKGWLIETEEDCFDEGLQSQAPRRYFD